RDPMVGRDLLSGVLIGVVGILFTYGIEAIQISLNRGEPGNSFIINNLNGLRGTLGSMASILSNAVTMSVLFLLALFFLRVLLRKQWLAAVVFVVLGTLLEAKNGNMTW